MKIAFENVNYGQEFVTTDMNGDLNLFKKAGTTDEGGNAIIVSSSEYVYFSSSNQVEVNDEVLLKKVGKDSAHKEYLKLKKLRMETIKVWEKEYRKINNIEEKILKLAHKHQLPMIQTIANT